jgi:DNA topoisomerase-1
VTGNLNNLQELYGNAEASALLVGLTYIGGDMPGITRVRRGTGFSYRDANNNVLHDKALRKHIDELVIPPAWHEVWICPDDRGHILATGIDEKGRKQYLYHPKWRTMRDLLKFYRLIIFGRSLPQIRRVIEKDLSLPRLTREKVIGVMLWLLDNTYLRVGNDIYLAQNDSRGLTTLIDKNLVVAGSVITLSFRGKSGKEQQITFEDARIAKIIEQLTTQRGSRLFRYKQNAAISMLSQSTSMLTCTR